MAITLAEAKVGMADKVDQQVIDMFRRSSVLLDSLTFDNAISPGTGGSTLAYGYIQLKTPSTAAVRAINSEYTAGEAKREEKTAKAVIMGGSFKVDRVIQSTSGAVDELAFQAEQKVIATSNYFHNLVINGSSNTSADGSRVINTFDGLDKTLTDASTEVDSATDLSTSALMDTNANAFLDEVDEWLTTMDGMPDALIMNTKMLAKFRSIARRAGYYTRSRDDFGRVVETYNGIQLVNAGYYYNGTNTVDTIATSDNTAGTGKTDIYAVQFGLDAVHGISPTGTGVISSFMPDLTEPGAVKTGEVELVAGIVCKNTLKAGVLRGVVITPKAGE